MKYDDRDMPLMNLFKHIGKLLDDRLRSDLGEKGIHFGQVRILISLMRYGTLSQTAIGQGLDIKPATVTSMVKKMETSELIDRQRDAKDDRIINVSLTPKGKAAAEYAVTVIDRVEDDIRRELSPEEVGLLRNPLERIRDILGGSRPALV